MADLDAKLRDEEPVVARRLRPRRLQDLQRHVRTSRRRRAARPRRGQARGGRGHGRAYRLGGDEFCLLARSRQRLRPPHRAGRGALASEGEGFAVRCSSAPCACPPSVRPERGTPHGGQADVPRQAAAAGAGRGRSTRQAVRERYVPRSASAPPAWRPARDAVARGLRLSAELEHVRQAAELHDVGKLAIPDAILTSRAPAPGRAVGVHRRHRGIGERILAVAPACGGGRARPREPRALGRDGLPGRAGRARRSRSARVSSRSVTRSTP